ncbi:MAG TPA: HEAT repeat domain-containing protein [Gemmatimonadaceae bacterium]|nr:HEAT repeat domain-containing protein [Gemmatimonadaceae bacterium]
MHARTLITGLAITASVAAIVVAQPRPVAANAAVAAVVPLAPIAGWQQALAELPTELPPEARFPADPADSIYRLARQALSRDDFLRAANLFRQIREDYPESAYAPDAMYWEAYALFRRGGSDDLVRARGVLYQLAEQHPEAAERGDAPALRARVQGALAARGDADAAAAVVRAADGAPTAEGAPSSGSAPGAAGRRAATAARANGCPAERDDERIAALNALLQMDADRALPLLERVLARRDECSAELRRRAIFLVAQKESPRREEIILQAIRNDPDPEVREQAVFWLAETRSERATAILEELLRTSSDERILDKAIFALSNQDTPRARQVLREYATRAGGPRRLREQAIFWIGQHGSAEDAAYLRQLYGQLDDQGLKERVLFSLAQKRGVGNERWLMDVVRNQKESPELRGKAIFWLGQENLVSTADLASIYDGLDDAKVKDQLIFALSQRPNDRAAVDKMMDIARRDPDRKLRQRAVFWLSQSQDPRVVDFLMELIDR